MRGYGFSKFQPNQIPKGGFEELLKLFLELLNYTAGDAAEALAWLNELDKQYNLTNDEYGMGDFIDELKQKGYLDEDKQGGGFNITAKTEQSIRQSALEEIFGKLKKSGKGNHRSPQSGQGDEKECRAPRV
jgi:Ca-activated chloride channel family protein